VIIDPSLLLKIMPYVAAAVEKIKGKKTGLPEMLQILPEITKAFKDPSIGDELKKTPENKEEVPKAPDKDTGLTIGGGLSGKYNSLIPGLLGIGKDDTIFDRNFNVGQLGIHPYNDTPMSLIDGL